MMTAAEQPVRGPGTASPSPSTVTAVVPVRNAERLLPGCLESLRRNGIGEVVVVDGLSSDSSRDIARTYGATVLSDEGRGLPHARTLGVRAARTRWVLLADSDVVFPDGGLTSLLEEYWTGGYDALQAGLRSTAGPGYWGQALAEHHLHGRSRWWFGLVATVAQRSLVLEHGFDDVFASGEDIELRWRLRGAGLRTGVSRRTLVEHRFADDGFDFAKDQFLMDGTGLGLMMRKHGWRGLRLTVLPASAAVRGTMLAVTHGAPRWTPYYAAYCWFNYVGMVRGLLR